jgi:hypothetical protein
MSNGKQIDVRSYFRPLCGHEKNKSSHLTARQTPCLKHLQKVSDVKTYVEKETGVASNMQRLIFLGKVLKNTSNLCEYAGMLDGGSTIHMVKRANAAPDDQQQQQQQRPSAAAGRNMFPFQLGGAPGMADTVCVFYTCPVFAIFFYVCMHIHVEMVVLHVFLCGGTL